jgi:hypothetical protein
MLRRAGTVHYAPRAQLVQQVLIQIALHILLLLADLHLVDKIVRLDLQTRLIDLALLHLHILANERFSSARLTRLGKTTFLG